MYDNNNIFRKIIDQNKDFIYEDQDTIVINDKYPQDNIHLLVLPRQSIENIYQTDNDIIVKMFNTIRYIVKKYNIENNFRLIINNGKKSGQEINHLHIHIISSGR